MKAKFDVEGRAWKVVVVVVGVDDEEITDPPQILLYSSSFNIDWM